MFSTIFKRSNFKQSKGKHLHHLKRLARHTPGSFSFGSYNIDYTDPLALYHEINDIFNNRIYHFESKTRQPNIIDAGGYIGLATLYFKSIYPDAKITVFEPDPSIFSVLEKNMQQNNLKDLSLVKSGLGKKNDTCFFYQDQSDGGSIYQNTEAKKIKVNITTLSKYITKPIDLLKMNIEGAEGDVFEEIKDKLPLIKEIIFEYHAFSDLPQNLGNILNLLDKNGFRYAITDATSAKIPVPFNLQPDYKMFNLVYAKNKNL